VREIIQAAEAVIDLDEMASWSVYAGSERAAVWNIKVPECKDVIPTFG
jgi:hypothetical protein